MSDTRGASGQENERWVTFEGARGSHEACGEKLPTIPPFDMMSAPSLKDLARIPGASVSVQYTLTDAPFGQEIDYHQIIVDGRIETLAEGWIPEAELYIELPYVNYLRLRLGEIELLEALRGGGFRGELAKASLLAGVLEAPEYQEAWTANADVISQLLVALTSDDSNEVGDPATLERLRREHDG